MGESLDAKAKLDVLLLRQGNGELTENEVQIMYYLCLDSEIQAHLRANMKPRSNR